MQSVESKQSSGNIANALLADVAGVKITLCGSTKFKKVFEDVNRWLTLSGAVVYSVSCFGHADKIPFSLEEKELLDKVHKLKIDNSDEIFVLDVNNYIGASTQTEIIHARNTGKKVRYLIDYLPQFEYWSGYRVGSNIG